ncbi:MAG TPA: PKD domain-containing protein, partial [Enterococcus sp.]|nr:PKD domain-containing protein [Enterococcus sp.]
MTADGSIKRFFNFEINEESPFSLKMRLNYFDNNEFIDLSNEHKESDFTIWKRETIDQKYENLKRDVLNTTLNFVEVNDVVVTAGKYTVADEICKQIPNVQLVHDTEICEAESIVLSASQNLDATKKPYYFAWSTTAENVFLDSINTDSILRINDVRTNHSGTYKVTVIDEKGCFASDTITITVRPKPKALIENAHDECQYIEQTFTDSSRVAYGTITNYQWNFGDGSISNTKSPVKAYTLSKSFNVQLKVTSNYGCTDSTAKQINIYAKPIADFTFDNYCKTRDSILYFYENIGFEESTLTNVVQLVRWTTNGDTLQKDDNDPNFNDPDFNFDYKYEAYGYKDVTLFVQSHAGCLDTLTIDSVYIYPEIIPKFLIEDVCFGEVSSFINRTEIEDSSQLKYNWYFNGDDYTNSKHPSKHFAPDTLAIKMTAINRDG